MHAREQQEQHEAAALPWGASNNPPELPPAPEPDLPVSHLNLQLGDRLEVLWELEEDGREPYTKWWGAVLDQRLEGKRDGEGRQVYMVKYDAAPDNGFEEQECCEVTFLDKRVLYALDDDDELPWRRAGDSWEPPRYEEGQAPVYSMSDIAAQIEMSARRRGRTLEQDAAEVLSAFPPEHQHIVAAGFRSFVERLGDGIAQLYEQHGPGYVIREADINALTDAATRAARKGGGPGELP